jgi:pSer/pThr/pTyr-binding forkhead associated (FHA) protein
MSLIAGSVCRSCNALNAWDAQTCRACLLPIDPSKGGSFTARIMQSGRGGGAELAVIRGAGSVSIGRTRGDITFPSDRLMSPRHAVFSSDASGFKVVDAGSLNGVFLRISRAPVRIGDTFMCAPEVMRFAGLNGGAAGLADAEGTGIFGSPAPWPGSLVIQQILLGGRTGRTWVLQVPVTIGRTGCGVCFPDTAFVSASHAVIEEDSGGLVLRDLGSVNGTFIKVQGQARLADGDTVLLGRQMLQVRIEG